MGRIDLFTRSDRATWWLAAVGSLFLLFLLQLGFVAIQRSEAVRAFEGIKSIFRNEELSSNPFLITKELLDLRHRGIVECLRLSDMSGADFLSQDTEESCEPVPYFIGYVKISDTVQTISGHSWKFSASIPSSNSFVISVWSIRVLVISLWTLGVFFFSSLSRLLEKEREVSHLIKERSDLVASISRQVGHDIRSPLSALNMVASSLPEVSDEKISLIKNAIGRINDIANDLLIKGKMETLSAHQATGESLIHLEELIKSIVQEKHLQYRESSVVISTDIGQERSFVSASSKELKRIISNIINNSVEAFENRIGNEGEQSEVTVSLRTYADSVQLCVSDNGVGIPDDVLEKIGHEGYSYGKADSGNSGSGLGVFHAKSYISQIGGSFQIQSRLGVGTMIKITLKKAAPGVGSV